MRHLKNTCKLNRTSSHRRCMMANLLKSLITKGQIETTLAKAKILKRHADKMITLAKKNTLATKRQAISKMMIRFNKLTPKEYRTHKKGVEDHYNDDRNVIDHLFNELGPRFSERQGGYTRIIRTGQRRLGDASETCIVQYLTE